MKNLSIFFRTVKNFPFINHILESYKNVVDGARILISFHREIFTFPFNSEFIWIWFWVLEILSRKNLISPVKSKQFSIWRWSLFSFHSLPSYYIARKMRKRNKEEKWSEKKMSERLKFSTSPANINSKTLFYVLWSKLHFA